MLSFKRKIPYTISSHENNKSCDIPKNHRPSDSSGAKISKRTILLIVRIYRGGAVHPIHGDEARFWHGGPGRWMFEETQPSTAVLALSRLGSKNLKGEVMKLNVFLFNQLEKKWEHKMYQEKMRLLSM